MKKISFLTLFVLLASCITSFAQLSIKSGDPLAITLRGVPQEEQVLVGGPYVVAPNGTIRMPMIKPIRATGITAAALGLRIEKAYKNAGIYTSPAVSVINQRANEERQIDDQRFITLAGQVVKAGPVQYKKGMTLFQAIQNAGGPNIFGNMKKVKLLRKGKERIYDLRNNKNKEIKVYPEDTIIITQKGIF